MADIVAGTTPAGGFKDHEHGPEMVVVPAGRFKMGSAPAEIADLARASGNGDTGAYTDGSAEAHPGGADWWTTEGPRHEVTIASPFAVGRYPVTRGQFNAFVAGSGYEPEAGACVWTGTTFEHDSNASWRAPGFAQGDDHPVVCVNWHDAQAYAAWLSRVTGKTYRLPSEAEREYATRAGTTTPFWWGASISPGQARYGGGMVYRDCRPDECRGTASVGGFDPNPWGLYQVHGNVWEWCQDCWHENYDGAPANGSAWTTPDSARRVIRGGSWVLYPELLRAANRLYNPATGRSHDLGFRLAQTLAA